MRRKTSESVVVVTGASSGIGRATALAFAKRGATVLVAARREHLLRGLVRECEALGGQALAVPLDVTDRNAVQNLARQAVEKYGRIDVWVNNAAVTSFGQFEETPYDDLRRVLEVNLFGYIHGARAVLPYFREQGSGVLINNASMVASVAQPYTSYYTISKHAIKAMGMSLRQELRDAPGIAVCTVMPATINTPFFRHAANYTGRAVRAMPPVYPPEKVANAILALSVVPKREVYVGNSGRMMAMQMVLFPGLAERLIAEIVERMHLYPERAQEPTSGNLFEPMDDGPDVTGEWDVAGNPPGLVPRLVATALSPALATTNAVRQRLTR